MTFGDQLQPTVDGAGCPHMAVLLENQSELHAVLASFYRLGARRNGWLVHRCLEGEEERDRAALTEHGLDVRTLEAEDRLQIVQIDFDDDPVHWPEPWSEKLDRRLEAGFDALWYSRFAIGPEHPFEKAMTFDRSWDRVFADRPVVTLCPYIVGTLSAGERDERMASIGDLHPHVFRA
jgi:DcmR-like sensory protein